MTMGQEAEAVSWHDDCRRSRRASGDVRKNIIATESFFSTAR